MKHMKQRRLDLRQEAYEDDPMSGIANLFDVGLVFIVGLLVTLFAAYHLEDLFSQTSELTIIKQSGTQKLEIIEKKGASIKARKITKTQAGGEGRRLGTAYRLKDGTMIYVPD